MSDKKIRIRIAAQVRWPHIEFPEDVGKIRTDFHVLNFCLLCAYCPEEGDCASIMIEGATAWITTCGSDVCINKAIADKNKLEPFFY